MSVLCDAPDSSIGVALRLSIYVDCQARALAEDGFQELVDGPVAAGLLGAVVTLFVALIGYRLLVGDSPSARDGLGWAVRLGFVLALVTAWPAFQTLGYNVAVDGPEELARVLLPAAGLPSEVLDQRVQSAYDTLRLGGAVPSDPAPQPDPAAANAGLANQQAGAAATMAPAPAGLGAAQTPRPITALLLVLGTVGLTSALRIAVGFLLAIAPLPIMALLFDATAGLFAGWAGTLGGAALAVLATTIVTALGLPLIEGEIASLQVYSRGMVAAKIDPQAPIVLVVFFALAALIAAALALRVTGRLRAHVTRTLANQQAAFPTATGAIGAARATAVQRTPSLTQPDGAATAPSRAALLAGALTQTVNRTQAVREASARAMTRGSTASATERSQSRVGAPGIGAAGRRTTSRQARSAASRDRTR